MILLAEGLFRLDVSIHDDTLRTVVRNLSPGELAMHNDRAGYAAPGAGSAEVARYEPTESSLEFTLGAGKDRVKVDVVLATLRFADSGVYRVTAQAVIRQAPVAEETGS